MRRSKLNLLLCALMGAAALTGCGSDPGPAGPAGPAGQQGQPGEPGTPGDLDVPSVSAILPNTVYLERTLEVTIMGNATSWTDAATVDFGPGVKVEGILVPSPTSIIAAITIDGAADLGTRDVVVTEGKDTTTYAGGFLVAPPLAFDGYAGTLAQGSIFIGRVSQRDLTTPFDTAGAPDYTNLTLEAGDGTSAQINEAQSYAIDFLMFVDVNATADDKALHVMSGLQGGETSSLAPKALPIAARTPTALTLAGPNMATAPAKALESQLYSYTPGAHKLLTISAASQDPTKTPKFVLLPSSGSFADLISYGSVGQTVTETDAPLYVVFWDNTGDGGYDYELTIDEQSSDDLEPNNVCAMGQTVDGLPAALHNLSLTNEKDEDWFRITATAADVGKLIHVVTKPGDGNTDTVIEAFGGDCNALDSLGGPSADVDYHEDYTSTPITAPGDYWIKVSHSSYPFAGSLYDLDIALVLSENEPNDVCSQAQNFGSSLPAQVSDTTLLSDLDEDWFAFTAKDTDVGKTVVVTTSPGDAKTDTVVEVFEEATMGLGCGMNDANLVSLGQSSDADYHESLTSSPLTHAGTFWVKVFHSSFPYSGAAYVLDVDLQ